MFIERISGKCVKLLPTGLIIDVNGVGYGLEIPLSVLYEIKEEGAQVELWVYSHVREDAIKLFGFSTHSQRKIFETLLGLNGVGPQVALAMISTLGLESIKNAVLLERTEVFESVPRIGKRLAEKILVELKPKIKHFDDVGVVSGATSAGLNFDENSAAAGATRTIEDVKSALENFGYKSKQIDIVMNRSLKEGDAMDFQSLMRRALVSLGAGPS